MVQLKDWQIKKENGIYDKRNQINELTGKEWLFSTRSVKTKNYSFYFDILKALEANYFDFIPGELISELILTFSKSSGTIIDPISNFGSIGLAVSKLKNNLLYYGFNHNQNSDIIREISNNRIYYEKENIYSTSKQIRVESKANIFSELIFSSLDPESRKKQFLNFKSEIIRSIELLESKNIVINYIILCVQNTKENFNYCYNSASLTTLMEKYSYNLKSELIWKIPESVFLQITNYVRIQKAISTNSYLLLNDKRILIYKKG